MTEMKKERQKNLNKKKLKKGMKKERLKNLKKKKFGERNEERKAERFE